jgi:RNA polymerase sigma-70 factor (ECF subfamily)
MPQREAIVLCFEGFSYGEVGEVLGISANAATLRCQRAKTALKTMMGSQH